MKLAVESVFVRRIAVTYMCQPQGQNFANVVFALLHRGSRTPCHFISVLLPSAENSSGLGSKPTSSSVLTHDSPPRTIEECNYLLTYLLTRKWCSIELYLWWHIPIWSRIYHIYRSAPFSTILNDPITTYQGHVNIRRWICHYLQNIDTGVQGK